MSPSDPGLSNPGPWDLQPEKTLVALFEASAASDPDAVALRFKDLALSYGELNARANQMARQLLARGVGRDRIAALLIDRSLEMMIAVLAVLKAGGAYLPIPPKTPDARVSFLLQDSDAVLVLAQRRYLSRATACGADVVIDVEDGDNYQGDTSDLGVSIGLQDLVYVIYTSGTTGKPKGVMIEHHALCNRLNWMQKRYPLGRDDVILQKTCYSFDVSVWELLWWSITGAQLCFLEQGHELFPQAIIAACEECRVTTMHFVPSMMGAFLEYVARSDAAARLSSVRRVFASGEELTAHHVTSFNDVLHAANGTCLTNLYGPTEATIDVTYYDCPTAGEIGIVPIGRAIDNTRLYVMQDGQRQAVGHEGELCISGRNVARGYLNRPGLTAEKFLPDPFTPGERMYRTGDLVEELVDGQIRYLGRIDNQIKINGKRIEPGEIESCICQLGGIEKCAVVATNTSRNVFSLVAFLKSFQAWDRVALLAHLRAELPDHMVPSEFVEIDDLPILSSGKIDRKSLVASYQDRKLSHQA